MDFSNIVYKGDVCKYIQAADDEYSCISLYKDIEYFEDEINYSRFVKHCESRIRTSKEYKVFLNHITRVWGINFCQVSSHIYDTDASIEMHHGPIFTLYDITAVILNYFLATGKKINSFRIVDAVIDEHFALRVQVVMLAVTNHEAFHNRDLFINVKQGIGDVNAFIKKYGKYFDDDQKYKVWNFLNICKDNKSFDYGYLDVSMIEKMIQL